MYGDRDWYAGHDSGLDLCKTMNAVMLDVYCCSSAIRRKLTYRPASKLLCVELRITRNFNVLHVIDFRILTDFLFAFSIPPTWQHGSVQ